MGGKISVIVPIYNVEPYLRQCLDSLFGQTYGNLEIILIDDGSPDRCGDICDAYAAGDGRGIVIHRANGGVSVARNDGIERATGQWLAFFDPDDWCEPDYYEKLVEALGNQEADILCAGGAIWEYEGSAVTRAYSKGSFFYERAQHADEWTKFSARAIDSSVVTSCFETKYPGGFCWDKLYRAELIKERGIAFAPGLHPCEDELINFAIFDQSERIAGCNCIGYHYRQTNAASATKKKKSDCVRGMIRYIEGISTYRDRMPQSNILDSAIQQSTLSCYRSCIRDYLGYGIDEGIGEELNRARRENPCVKEAIWSRNHHALTRGNLLLKHLLRIPGMWPLRLYYSVERRHLNHKFRSEK